MHNFKAHIYIPHAAVLVPALLQTSVPVQSVLAEHSGSTKRIESYVLKSVYWQHRITIIKYCHQ